MATGSAETFVRAHMLLSGGNSRYMEGLDTEAFIEQANEAEKIRDSDIVIYLADTMGSFQRTHPLPAWRVHHGIKWARTEAFFKLLAGQYTPTIEKK